MAEQLDFKKSGILPGGKKHEIKEKQVSINTNIHNSNIDNNTLNDDYIVCG